MRHRRQQVQLSVVCRRLGRQCVNSLVHLGFAGKSHDIHLGFVKKYFIFPLCFIKKLYLCTAKRIIKKAENVHRKTY